MNGAARFRSAGLGRAIVAVLTALSARAGAEDNAPSSVVVEGERSRVATRDATAASTVVAGEALESAGTSAADVLSRVPGVEVSRTGSSSDLATAAIRGATSAETPVYLAGVRLNDDVTGTADLSTLPLFMIDRVEVYRGNAPLAADRLGIGGAVFFEPRFPASTEVGAGLGAGSFGQRAGWISGAVHGERAAALIAVRHDSADNDFSYGLDDGTTRKRTNADFSATDAWTLARFRLGAGKSVTTIFHAYDREQGSPGLAPIEDETARTHTRRLLAAADARIPCGHDVAGAESCSLEFVSSGVVGSAVVTDASTAIIGASFVSTTSTRFEEEARISARAGDAWTFGGSAIVGFDHIDIAHPGVTSARAERITTRPGASVAWRATEGSEVVATGTLECHATDANGQGGSACPSPEPGVHLGARQELRRGLELRANLGHYVRVPTLGELYGVSAVVRGNPSLLAESGDTVELGARASGAASKVRATLDVFGFARFVENLVSYRQNVLGVIVPVNVGHARVLGAEVSGSLDIARVVRTDLAATLLDARDTTPTRTLTNDILPFRSRLVFTDFTEVYTDAGVPRLHVDRAALGVRVTRRSSRYADEGGLIVIPHQTVFDLEGSLHFLHRSLVLRASLRNVFAAREVDSVGFPLPGRSAYATLEGFFR